MRTLCDTAVAAGTGDTHVFSPRSWRRVTGPTGRRCRYVRKTQLEMAAAASAGHTRPPRDRNLNRLMVLGLPNPFKPQKEGSTGMTVPAIAPEAASPRRVSHTQGPGKTSPGPTVAELLAAVHRHPGVTDAAYRFFTVVITTYGMKTFTLAEAAEAAGYTPGTAGNLLGVLVQADVLAVRRMNDRHPDGRPSKVRVYWLAGGYR